MRSLSTIRIWIYSALSAFWFVERMVGLAGLPDDWRKWRDFVTMVPDPIGWMALGAFTVLMLRELWEIVKTRRAIRAISDDSPIAVDYLAAGAIIDHYISPAVVDMKPHLHLIVRKDLLDKFGQTTGAKLSEYEYNGALLRQWLESNAARFIVDYRGEMR